MTTPDLHVLGDVIQATILAVLVIAIICTAWCGMVEDDQREDEKRRKAAADAYQKAIDRCLELHNKIDELTPKEIVDALILTNLVTAYGSSRSNFRH